LNLDTNIVGRVVPNPYPSGGTWTVTALEVVEGKIYADILWSNDGLETSGTLAPGTALWDALERDRRDTRCGCESSHCREHRIDRENGDHRVVRCDARATGRFRMGYVGRVCEDCARNACLNDGAQYIHLHPEGV
jgi:hypothetical protein